VKVKRADSDSKKKKVETRGPRTSRSGPDRQLVYSSSSLALYLVRVYTHIP
jgi:hypothetical protein